LLFIVAGGMMLFTGLMPLHANLINSKVRTSEAVPLPSPLMENIGRSLVAVKRAGDIYVGWRLLATDPADTGFNLYRTTDFVSTKINTDPLTATTDYVDTAADLTKANSYFVRPVVGGVEQITPSNTFTLAANAPTQQYLSVPIQIPAGGTSQQAPGNTTGQSAYTYNANDASVADLDGDGVYEIILKWDPSNSRDTASAGLSGPVVIDAYKMDGTRLWRINFGKNIRAGAHYTQFMVYDLDGDGKAEMVAKTADGTVDGVGTTIGDGTKDYRSLIVPTDSDIPVAATNDVRFGKTIAGPEFLTVFNGQTGAAMSTVPYVPTRYPLDGWGGNGGNGGNDTGGNRVDRFLAGVAYLDGQRPSVIMARGYYGRSVLVAWDWRNGQLTQRWIFDSVDRDNPFSGQGAHSLSIADVDADGKDEVIYHGMTLNDDGTGMYSTGLRHGDATHVSDLDPARPGLEVFGVHETETTTNPAFQSPASSLHDARTGEIIWTNPSIVDAGRGVCSDIDPTFPGAECWGGPGGTRNVTSVTPIYTQTPSSQNFAIWWDSDLLRELEDTTSVSKFNYLTKTTSTILATSGTASNNGTKATPTLTADLLGDWREEVIFRASNNLSLRIYTTTDPAINRMVTLMQDRQYRMAIAWQNVAYNQPPWPSFFIGDGMAPPPVPGIRTGLVTGTSTVAGTFSEGGTVTYTTVITNNGFVDQADNPGDEFVDNLPTGLTLVSATSDSGTVTTETAFAPSATAVKWNGALPVGSSVTITITATVGPMNGGVIVNNQGVINFDSNGDGTNELSVVTDDPALAGSNNATGFRFLGPTAATVSITGRVLNANGNSIGLANVVLSGTDGVNRTALTNQLGYYTFEDIGVGQTCVISVSSKRYSFEPRVVTVTEEMTELNLIAAP
jgi:rhamnogalacturonan endolyase